jgi:DNA-binding response OmpR family regulator
MGSDNGTQINGQPIESGKQYPLKHGQTLGLAIIAGKPRVTLRFWDSDDTTMAGISAGNEINAADWLRIDENSKQVWIDGSLLDLSKKEYKLVCYLCRNNGKFCSKDSIIEEVWSEVKDPGAVSDAAIETLIHRLREKVEPNPSSPKRIISRKGFGYMLLDN